MTWLKQEQQRYSLVQNPVLEHHMIKEWIFKKPKEHGTQALKVDNRQYRQEQISGMGGSPDDVSEEPVT